MTKHIISCRGSYSNLDGRCPRRSHSHNQQLMPSRRHLKIGWQQRLVHQSPVLCSTNMTHPILMLWAKCRYRAMLHQAQIRPVRRAVSRKMKQRMKTRMRCQSSNGRAVINDPPLRRGVHRQSRPRSDQLLNLWCTSQMVQSKKELGSHPICRR